MGLRFKSLKGWKAVGTGLLGATLGMAGCTWQDVYEQASQPMEATRLFQDPSWGAVQDVLVEDVNGDGQLDVVALFNGMVASSALPAQGRVLALTGNGKGGFKELARLELDNLSPERLGVWKPRADAKTQIVVYGSAADNGTVEGTLHLFSVGTDGVEAVNRYSLGPVYSGSQVALQTLKARADGTQHLFVGGYFAPQADLGGAPVGQIKMLASPSDGEVTTLGPVQLASLGTDGSTGPLAVADITGDGRVDVVTTNQDDGTVQVQVQNDDGTFTPQAPVSWEITDIPEQVITGDFNGDGQTDVRVVFESCYDVLFTNDNGELRTTAAFHTVMDPTLHAVAADVNGDQRADMILTGTHGDVDILVLRADGTVEKQLPKQVLIRDGAVAGPDGAPLPVRVLTNAADKLASQLETVAKGPENWNHGELHIAAGDVNADGMPDMLLGTADGQVVMHLGE